MVNEKAYASVMQQIRNKALLVVVTKNQNLEDIQKLYELGQRDFGENRVQELLTKYEALPKDIKWHMIGHLQSNKVKYITPFVHLIHSVDSIGLATEIDQQAQKCNRTVSCLLQVKIAIEQNKYGVSQDEVAEALSAVKNLQNINIKGFMGVATNTTDENQIRNEFRIICELKDQFKKSKLLAINSQLSLGMSSDWQIALQEGATILRIGSLLFNPVEK